MPSKNKTNKSVKKRLKVTAHGKLKYAKTNRRHLNAHIPSKRMRRLRRPGIIAGRPSVQKKYKMVLGEL
ncbi:large ribosomal subunit protein bL35 [Thermogemmata fonticola]|jgi:large subunit ribosomal protein L35|uniref:Large ribosomal subunit protein bL35 n=1 Tax=Thermogemmata fonticola TaxID=2755323 RepID=A0A7V9AA74_9BACT|nr:50S ribosomal protein L35 [Thermogemmata fonticola]MBA2224811.1 50S ribosomal protein L35 [Thermogemmata fonticola]